MFSRLESVKNTTFTILAGTILVNLPLASAQEVEEEVPLINETITVLGAPQEKLYEFIGEVVVEPQSAESLSRWTRPLCIGVAGLQEPSQAQYVADTVARNALEVGLKTRKEGCIPNLSIIFTDDAPLVAKTIAEKKPEIFAINHSFQSSTASQAEYEKFLSSERAVRWWHVSQTVDQLGKPVQGAAFTGPDGGVKNAPIVRSYGSTRLKSSTRESLSHAIIIVDTRLIDGIRTQTIADYLAMVSLAQIAPDGDVTKLPSILNLFTSSTPNSALTEWDKSFLNGLYSTRGDTLSFRQEKAQIATKMRKGTSD